MKRLWISVAVWAAVAASCAQLVLHRRALSAALLEGVEHAFNAMDSLLHPAA
ncbi:MAG TPA: hypothetical protein VMT82_00610 [candidate division Zixibacteria bacterium]|nr:hypothetical protein [candidate division Zixibacteria bacterium]